MGLNVVADVLAGPRPGSGLSLGSASEDVPEGDMWDTAACKPPGAGRRKGSPP